MLGSVPSHFSIFEEEEIPKIENKFAPKSKIPFYKIFLIGDRYSSIRKYCYVFYPSWEYLYSRISFAFHRIWPHIPTAESLRFAFTKYLAQAIFLPVTSVSVLQQREFLLQTVPKRCVGKKYLWKTGHEFSTDRKSRGNKRITLVWQSLHFVPAITCLFQTSSY